MGEFFPSILILGILQDASIFFLNKSKAVKWTTYTCGFRFVQQKLGGPSLAEYEKVQAEFSELQIRYTDLLAMHQEKCREV